MTVLCVIGARGGSLGVPGKNIRPMLGKPLIVWSIEHALATLEIDRVVVSTDSPAIAKVAKEAGAEVPFMRPESLAGPEVGKFQVWQHVLVACENHFGEQYECFVDLDCTTPLRDPEDISKAIAQLRAGRSRGVDAVFSVCQARRNPYFNMVEPDQNGAMRFSKTLPKRVLCRQDAPPAFDHVGAVYVLVPEYLRRANHLLDGHAEGYEVGPEKSLDVDSELDFALVEFLMGYKSGKPSFTN